MNHLLQNYHESIFSYSDSKETYLYELEVASGTTASQLLEVDLVKELSSEFPKDYKIGVNSELLDGEFRPTPEKYRLKEERGLRFTEC